uniref:Uncharacterized protein n=1 Tax=Caulobacter sp. (strain K31) TaxID=366602 RepID=B0T6J2_CAUSK
MTEEATPPIDAALLPIINALARVVVAEQQRDMDGATAEIAELRGALNLQNDFPAWKLRVEGLMQAFYDHVPHWHAIPFKSRLRLMTAAVREVGCDALTSCIAIKASELAEVHRPLPPRRRRRA